MIEPWKLIFPDRDDVIIQAEHPPEYFRCEILKPSMSLALIEGRLREKPEAVYRLYYTDRKRSFAYYRREK